MAVKKVDTPLLIIGLGGAGMAAAARVKQVFSQKLEKAPGRDVPPRTRFLVIDTDEMARRAFPWEDDEYFSIANDYLILRDDLTPWERQWFDEVRVEADRPDRPTDVAPSRQMARLSLLRRSDALRCALEAAIRGAREAGVGEDANRQLEICVITGLAGNTGSGILLDVAYLLRHVLRGMAWTNLSTYFVEAMVMMPDVAVAQHPHIAPAVRERCEANGYAALKELDFWMNFESHHHAYTQRYFPNLTISWEGAPFDDVVLLSATNMAGALVSRPQERLNDLIAEYLLEGVIEDYDDLTAVQQFNGTQGHLSVDYEPRQALFATRRERDLARAELLSQGCFVPYRYRSIGAYSFALEDDAIRDRSWAMTLDEITQRMEDGRGSNDDCSCEDFRRKYVDRGVGCCSESQLRQAYQALHPIPDVFGTMDANALREVDYPSAPHGAQFEFFRLTLVSTRSEDVAALKPIGRQILHNALQSTVEDLDKGPEYCLRCLTARDKGLLVALRDEVFKAQDLCRNAEDYIEQQGGPDGRCEFALQELKRLPIVLRMVRGGTRFEVYRDITESLYQAAQAAGYYRALAEVLTDLMRYVSKYANALDIALDEVHRRREEYNQRVRDAQFTDAWPVRLLDGDRVAEALRACFDADGARDQAAEYGYRAIAQAVDAAQGETAESSREVIARSLDQALEYARQSGFSDIEGMKLDEMVHAFAPPEAMELRDYVSWAISPRMDAGASPMFHPVGPMGEAQGNAVETRVITAPGSARATYIGIDAYLSSRAEGVAVLKAGMFYNRLVWMRSIAGLPLMACAELPAYRRAYLRELGEGAPLHLCMKPGAGLIDPVAQDWQQLPEPLCDRQKALSDGEARAEALLRAGVLSVDVRFVREGGVSLPECALSWKRLQPLAGEDAVTAPAMAQTVERALEGVESAAERLRELRRLRGRYDAVPLTLHALKDKAEAWADVLDLGGEVRTVMDGALSGERLDAVKNAWVRCFQRAAFEYLSRAPQLLNRMEVSAQCFDLIDEGIFRESAVERAEVLANAETFGRLYRHGLIDAAGGAFVSEEIAGDRRAIIDEVHSAKAVMERLYPNYAWFLPLIQNILYYAAQVGGRDEREAQLLEALPRLEREAASALADGEADASAQRAEALRAQLQADGRAVRILYTDGVLDEDERDEVDAVLEAILAETDRYLRGEASREA